MKAHKQESKIKNKWTVHNEGAFAGVTCLGPMNSQSRKSVFRAIQLAHECLVIANVKSRVRFGRACHTITKYVGEKGLREIARKFWLPDTNGKWRSLVRTMEISMQLYRFYNRKGPRLTKNIPIDSALNIFRHIKALSKKQQNSLIREVNQTSRFNGVEINKSKRIREAVVKAKKALASEQGTKSKKPKNLPQANEAIFELNLSVAIKNAGLRDDFKKWATCFEVKNYEQETHLKMQELVDALRSLEGRARSYADGFEAIVQFGASEGKKRSWKNCRWTVDELPWRERNAPTKSGMKNRGVENVASSI